MRDLHFRVRVILWSAACLVALGVAGCGDDDDPTGVDSVPPTVSSTSPADGATGVAVDANVSASFSEAMNASSITTTTFTLANGVTPVAGTVTYSSNPGATFNPASELLPNTVYTATLTTGATDVAGNPLAANVVWTFTTGTGGDATPPTVASTVPLNGQTNVAVGSTITASFSEAIDVTSLTPSTFLLTQGSTPIIGEVTYSGGVATFTPDNDLVGNTIYTATLTTGVTDIAGNHLAQDRLWSFTTAPGVDVTAPTVVSTVPPIGGANVAVGANLSASFSEAMNGATITNATFTLMQGATPVAGAVAYSSGTATFNPNADLAYNTLYTATITTGAQDASNNGLAANYVWTFTTAVAPDVTPPTVSAMVPGPGATGVGVGTNVTATFSEPMSSGTISGSTFTLMQGATPVSGTVTYGGTTATFNPNTDLTAGVLYTATITTGAMDASGNALAANHVWTFTTAPPTDVTPPTVQTTLPADGASEVAAGVVVTVNFSEAMSVSSLNSGSFTLVQGSTPIAGTVATVGSTATFTPTAVLAAGLTYTATVTTGATDAAGNPLAANFVWSFTVAGSSDATPPTVIVEFPEDHDIEVATTTNITATFSEPMNAATINGTTFTVTDGTTPVAGVVTYSGTTATFNPTGRLNPSTIYAARITTGAQDLASNGLATDFAWIFTTEDPPEVVLTIPPTNGFNISLSANITASFDKPMAAGSLTNATVRVNDGSSDIAGAVTYSGQTVVFNPTSPLAAGTVYTVTITTGATDVSGNGLASAYSWSFSTGSTTDVTAPTVISSDPAAGAGNVPRNSTVRVFFNEAMDPSSFTNVTFTVTLGGVVQAGTVEYVGTNAVFTPASQLAPSSVYTATVTTGVRDISGNSLSGDVSWTFTTAP